MKPTRTWTSLGRCKVEVEHPVHGLLLRGWIRLVGVQDSTEPTVAARLRWQVVDYDGHQLGTVDGDYVTAEQRLLDATSSLDD